ncbi:hypothetical protein ELG61_30125 (plasmid) [Rhizobium leguminosarum]|nr:hypothetical protein ELG86_31525 [Rhizobium leguminosarum]TBG96661.1 hypothetical protein ELG70_28210 [Rhizobium leguminosarum]TBH30964.1 hypothetical protein ELG66_28890 [Rhizobium leguminosarum]TBH47147.1 hypothetical protein ELG65_35250 [Rhizobium leguminosarum]TBH63257.1 hypothetical protein ELG61_30125 [Rhizobium leguminosarum]
MVPARSSRHGISCSWHLSRSQAEIPLIPAVQISRASSIRCSIIGSELHATSITWSSQITV